MNSLAKRLDRELKVMSNGVTFLSNDKPQAARLAPLPEGEIRTGPYLGASILASLGSFPEFIVTNTEYAECGTEAVERKCP